MLTRSRRVYERSWNTCPLVPILFSNYSPLFALSFRSFFPKRPGTGRMEKVPCMSDVAYIYLYIFNSLSPPWTTRVGAGPSLLSSVFFFFFFVKTLWRKKGKTQICRELWASQREDCHVSTTAPPLSLVSLVNNPAYIYIRRCCSRIDYIRPIIHIPFFFSPLNPRFSGLLLRVYRFFRHPRCRYS